MYIKGKERRRIVYDFEVMKTAWLVCLYDIDTGTRKCILNDRDELERVYNKHVEDIWIGYNSRHYDQYILKGIILGYDPYYISDCLINKEMKGYEVVPEAKQLTFYNYDCALLNTGLKQLEGFMGHSIIESSVPWDLDRELTKSELEELEKYCHHDVYETHEVFKLCHGDWDAQLLMLEEFNQPIESISKTKAQLSAKALGAKSVKTFDDFDYILPDTLILDKYQFVKEWFLDKKNHYYGIPGKQNSAPSLTFELDGVPTKVGLGGIHGALKKCNIVCKEDEIIIHADVASLYPSLIIEYGLMSRGVDDKDLYRRIRDRRIELKHAGDDRQQALKIVLNGTLNIA